ncbi:MAG: LysE family transporter [Proteobacteria bacterium]|nr:LysE family transporter [Pseudomonadota bacterium]
MHHVLFLKGLIIGFSIAAPVGPIGILCINRTLSQGLWAGLFSGVGAAVADAAYGCIAGFGLVSLSAFLLSWQNSITLIGGAFLIYLSIRTFLSSSAPKPLSDNANSLWRDFSSTFLLTMTNPATIISFLAIYASLGIVEPGADYLEASMIVLGVFVGSLIWWCILSFGVHQVRHKLSASTLTWINRLSSLVLFTFGVFALIKTI